ncbi:DMT family transporter [Desulfosporosinus sp. Sb-LF]|uniref:DMT family transporter n=1 Tax=Desulfosporosinus sp. Sb-LF TaxID=2560027 RepID=UPI00107F5D79|nr:DMT family transporter [Desulfosporosinus sp. Sb-LF]TGE34617.1 DMT family transporter [Desulfosporosinus sp. Sb-LF]
MLYIFLSAILLSTGGLFIKIVQANPLAIVALRSGIAGLTLLPFLRVKHIKLSASTIVYIFSYTVMMVAFVSATKYTTSANAVALQYAGSLYLFLYKVFRRQIKVRLGNVMPMAMIMMGIIAFLLEPSKGHNMAGNLLAVISGIALAAMFGALPQIKGISPVSLVCLSNLAIFALVFPLIPSHENLLAISSQGWMALIYLGVIQVALSYILNTKGVQLTSSLQAMVLAMFEAVMNPLWVFIFIGEVPSSYGFVGITLILGAVLFNVIQQSNYEKRSS